VCVCHTYRYVTFTQWLSYREGLCHWTGRLWRACGSGLQGDGTGELASERAFPVNPCKPHTLYTYEVQL
jgi:hypothetical protein